MTNNEAKKASQLNKDATTVKSNVITGERGTQAIDMTTENQSKAQKQTTTTVTANVITGERGTQALDMTTENQAKAQKQTGTTVTANVITGEKSNFTHV